MGSDWLDGMLEEVQRPDGNYFYKQASEENTKTVKKYLLKTYPAETLEWVDESDWTKKKVSLEDIKMDRRPGGAREQDKVKNIAEAFRNKESMEPVVLVKTPEGKMKVADGYHRTLGCKHSGNATIEAWVGKTDSQEGPWDKEMHEKKLNKGPMEKAAAAPLLGAIGRFGMGALKSTGKSLKNYGSGMTGIGAKKAKDNLAQVKLKTDATRLDIKGAKKDLRGERFNQAKAWGTTGLLGAGVGLNELAKTVQPPEQPPQTPTYKTQMK